MGVVKNIAKAVGIAALAASPALDYVSPNTQIQKATVLQVRKSVQASEIPLYVGPVYKVHFHNVEYPVLFRGKRWDRSIKPGDTVNAVVKDNFPDWGGLLEGVSVAKYSP